MPVRLYSQEMKQWLRDNVKGRSLIQLTEDFNKHFGTNFKTNQIGHLKGDLNLRNGNDTKFKKGQEANNKGQKMSEAQRKKLEHTWFQKGHTPMNFQEIGTEYVDVDGYIVTKVSRTKWIHKQRAVWEQHHGPIPKGYVIIFLDGNTQNCDINNLRMIKRSLSQKLTNFKMRSSEPLVTQAGASIVELLDEITNKRKGE